MHNRAIENNIRKIDCRKERSFLEESRYFEDILRSISEDRDSLRSLILALETKSDLFAMCEKDRFRYKLVLFVGENTDRRLRLHLWRTGFTDCAHGHRFNYTSLLLNGSYRHTLYDCGLQALYPDELRDIPENHYSVHDPIVKQHVDVTQIVPSFVSNVDAGQCYSQHHSVLSSTITQPDTVSLFIRGPSLRESSIQWDVEDETIIWRRGVARLTAEEQHQVSLKKDDYREVLAKLEMLHII